jgi:pimeloyl-ACP methyl ester carboxylesterase
MSEATHYDRRRFIGTAVTAITGAGLLTSGFADLGPWTRDVSTLIATTTSADRSPSPIKQVDAGALNVRYGEAGPSNGPPAILLHGDAGDIDSSIDVASLAARGYRVIVPYAAPSGVIALMAALKIEKALVGGVDGGARNAQVMAALWPQRLKGIAPVGGSDVVSLAANQRPLPPKEELAWWYQYYFVRDGVEL